MANRRPGKSAGEETPLQVPVHEPQLLPDQTQPEPEKEREVKQPPFRSGQPLTILYTNARSLISKIDHLNVLTVDHKPHIVLICETWLNSDICNSMLNISDYYIDNELRIDRTDTSRGIGGGLLVYVRNDVVVKADTTSSSNFNQFCQFQLVQKNSKMPVNVVLAYRSPNSTTDNDCELVKLFEKTKPNSLYYGDFNLPKTNFQVSTSDAKGKPILEVVENQFLDQLIDFPTHNKGNILDLIFTNMPDNVLSIENVDNLSNSDHCILKTELDISMAFNDINELIRDWRKGDQEGLIDCIKNINFPGIFQGKDASQQWATLREVTDIALDRYIPLTTRRKPGQPPWLTQAVIRVTRKKNRYWKRFTKNRSIVNFDNYKVMEKLCKKAVQTAKKCFERKIADSGNKRPFNSYVKSKTKTRHNVGPLKVNNVLVTENEDMAKELNTFFTSVFSQEAPGPLPPCPKLPSNSTLEDMWIDSDTVKKKILKLKPSSAPGPDKMSARFLIMNVEASGAGPVHHLQ